MNNRTATLPPLPVQEGVQFRYLPGFPGYAVGDDGSVWTCKRAGAAKDYSTTWKRRRLRPQPSGHLGLSLRGPDCKRVTAAVHRLVLEAFVGPCPEGMEGCYDPDRDPANNRLNNLRWDTHRENIKDAVRHGTVMPDGRPRGCPLKLNDETVREIRRLFKKDTPGYGARSLARQFCVTPSNIRQIVQRKTWRHVV